MSETNTPGARKPFRIAFLLSGAGRTLQNLIDSIAAGTLPAELALAVSSRAEAIGVARARQHRIPVAILDRKLFESDEAFNLQLTQQIEGARADLVCMGGFLHLWKFPAAYQGKVLNIHPALLPKFGGRGMFGMAVHKAVLAAGENESGCTVHFCDLEFDHGPTLVQYKVPVRANDTPEALAERVFQQECLAYPEAIRALHQERAAWKDGKVVWTKNAEQK